MSKQAITSDKLKKLKSNYEKKKNSILKDSYQATDTLPTFEIFDRASLEEILALEGCVGVRMYYVMDEKMEVQLVAVGIDEHGKDIQSAFNSLDKTNVNDPVIAFSSVLKCPPDCEPPIPPPPPPDEP
jgi:hypothetical protein